MQACLSRALSLHVTWLWLPHAASCELRSRCPESHHGTGSESGDCTYLSIYLQTLCSIATYSTYQPYSPLALSDYCTYVHSIPYPTTVLYLPRALEHRLPLPTLDPYPSTSVPRPATFIVSFFNSLANTDSHNNVLFNPHPFSPQQAARSPRPQRLRVSVFLLLPLRCDTGFQLCFFGRLLTFAFALWRGQGEGEREGSGCQG